MEQNSIKFHQQKIDPDPSLESEYSTRLFFYQLQLLKLVDILNCNYIYNFTLVWYFPYIILLTIPFRK